jgi:hypothetical protein
MISSCSNNNRQNEDQIVQNQTPKVLDDSKLETPSYSKRNSPDIILELFNEAISKDSELKSLNDKINEIDRIKIDSLNPYRDYIQTNDTYWASVYNYLSQLSDSTLKRDFKEAFRKMEAKYKSMISNHNYVVNKIDSKTVTLNDYEILMKLAITAPMMNNYQINEKPDLKSLNNLVNLYDTLIIKTRSYTVIEE